MSGPVGAVTPNNDAYGGGGMFRSAPPTSGPTGSLAGPNTSSLAAGVNPQSAPFYARPNEGTNIRIPYSRVTPLADPRATGLPDVSGPKASTPTSLMVPTDYRASMHGDALIKPYMSETDTLRSSRLAFILAKKSASGPAKMRGRGLVAIDDNGLREDERSNEAADARDFSYAINSTIAPSLPGTQRLQKLCSFEYAQRYVDVACNAHFPIVLEVSDTIAGQDDFKANKECNLMKTSNVAQWYRDSASYGGRLNSLVSSALARANAFDDKKSINDSLSKDLKTAGIQYEAGNTIEDTIDKLRTADVNLVNKFKNDADFAVLENLIAKSNHEDPFVMSGLPSANATLGSMDDIGMLTAEVGSQANSLSASPLARGTEALRPIRYTAYMATQGGPGNDGERGDITFAKFKRQYGIFTCDEGPFLRGHAAIGSTKDGLVAHGLLNSQRDPRNILRGVPSRVCTAEGDIVAFSVLESYLSNKGLFDWTPDGMCLSKFSNVPDDVLEDQRIDARDGVLYNVAIQGPAIATNWTGSSHLAVLPSDRVFIIIVADVFTVNDATMTKITNATKDTGATKKITLTAKAENAEQKKLRELELMLAYMYGLPAVEADSAKATDELRSRSDFAEARQKYMNKDTLRNTTGGYTSWTTRAKNVAKGVKTNHNVLLHNYRLEVATSSQMSGYSRLRFENGETGSQAQVSRMGLKLGTTMSEYIVGGWCIGSVMDSAASRASMPDGMSIGPRTAPNTSAINLYVDIEYWSGDKMYRKYSNVAGNKRGLVRARFEMPETKSVTVDGKTTVEDVDDPTEDHNLPSKLEIDDTDITVAEGTYAETAASTVAFESATQPIRQAAVNATRFAEQAKKLADGYGAADATDKPGIKAKVEALKLKVAAEVKIVTDGDAKAGVDKPQWLTDAVTKAGKAMEEANKAEATVNPS